MKLQMKDEDIQNEKIYLTLRGKEQFLSGDIEQFTNVFKVMNPDLLICQMEPSVTLEIELTITKRPGICRRGRTTGA